MTPPLKIVVERHFASDYTPAIGEAVKAIGSEIEVDPDTYTPDMTAAGSRTQFPFDDDDPLAVPKTPEVREYSVIGMIANVEELKRA